MSSTSRTASEDAAFVNLRMIPINILVDEMTNLYNVSSISPLFSPYCKRRSPKGRDLQVDDKGGKGSVGTPAHPASMAEMILCGEDTVILI